MADDKQAPKAAKPTLAKDPDTGLMMNERTHLVAVVLLRSEAGMGLSHGEVRGVDPETAVRMVKLGSAKLYDFDDPAKNAVKALPRSKSA